MPNLKTVQSSSRAFALAALAVFGLWVSAPGLAQAAPDAAVVAVEPTRVADLVLLDHGFDAGLRQGMICRVTRGEAAVAEVLLVEVRPHCSAALITSVAPAQSIRAGDVAAIKILKT